MQTRLINHLNECNIFRNEQYGFRPGLNTDNATNQLTNGILYALNNKALMGGMFAIWKRHFTVLIMKFFYLNLKLMV